MLAAEFSPGPACRGFEPHAFLLHLCPRSEGLRARWLGRRWVTGPGGRDVLVRVVLLEALSGAFYVAVARSQPGAVPVLVGLGCDAEVESPIAVGPIDLFDCGERVSLTLSPTE
jgi:hypothetical protein